MNYYAKFDGHIKSIVPVGSTFTVTLESTNKKFFANYTGLTTVNVSLGQKVKADDLIGSDDVSIPNPGGDGGTILAPVNGVITRIEKIGDGWLVVLHGDDGKTYTYASLSAVYVNACGRITAGTPIGLRRSGVFIWNQDDGPQDADFWIGGDGRLGGKLMVDTVERAEQVTKYLVIEDGTVKYIEGGTMLIRFQVDVNLNYPHSGEDEFILVDQNDVPYLLGKKITFFRELEKQYQDDKVFGYEYDSTTGRMKIYPAFFKKERIEIYGEPVEIAVSGTGNCSVFDDVFDDVFGEDCLKTKLIDNGIFDDVFDDIFN